MDAKTLRTASSSSNLTVSGTNLLDDAAASSTAIGAAAGTAAAAATTNNESAAAATTPPTAVTPTSILEAIKEQKEWAKAIVFESDGRVVAATVKPLDGEIDAFLKLFDKRDATIGSGIILLNEQYDVHRFHPPLIYGRRGDPAAEEGEGIALCRVEKKNNASKQLVYCLITYTYPTLSARAVPQLRDFCDTYLAYLP